MGNEVQNLYKDWESEAKELGETVDCTRCDFQDLHPEVRERWQNYKCCTFQPFVANFVLGSLLEQNPKFLSGLKRPVQFLKLGIVATPEFRELHNRTSQAQMSESQLCTFYDSQTRRCRIWSVRPSECRTYFCTGSDGRRQIRSDWSSKLLQREVGLAQMAAVYLGVEWPEVESELEAVNGSDGSSERHAGVSRGAKLAKRIPAASDSDFYLKAWQWFKIQSPRQIELWLTSDQATRNTKA